MEQALFYAKLEVLQQLLLDNIEEVLLSLKVNLTKGSKMYYGPCPLHGGDNQGGLNIYNENAKVPGYWRCNTHHCEREFKHKNLITFIQGILKTNFWGAIKWSCNLLKIRFDDLKGDLVKKEKVDFIRNYLNSKLILDKKKVQDLLVNRFVEGLKYPLSILSKEVFRPKLLLNTMLDFAATKKKKCIGGWYFPYMTSLTNMLSAVQAALYLKSAESVEPIIGTVKNVQNLNGLNTTQNGETMKISIKSRVYSIFGLPLNI